MTSQDKTIDVNVNFSGSNKLEQGNAVMFSGVRVGEVAAITVTDTGTSVVLSLDTDKAGIVQSNAAAVVSMDTPTIVRITNSSGASESVVDGSTLKGLNSALEDTAWQAGKAIGSVQEALQQAANTFQNYLQSDDWKRAQEDVQNNLNDLGKHSAEAAQSMRHGVEKMMTDLQSQSEETLREAEKHYGQIEEQLRQIGKDGQQDVINSMQRLLDSLKSAMEAASDQPGTRT